MFPSSPISPILSYFPKKMFLSHTPPALTAQSHPPNVAPKPHCNPRRMANSTPLLMLSDHTTDQPKMKKDASKFDIISAYKAFVSDPDVSRWSIFQDGRILTDTLDADLNARSGHAVPLRTDCSNRK